MKILPAILLSAFFLSACSSDSSSDLAESVAEDVQTAVTDNQQQFLIDNAARSGVTVADSGLQYELLRAGTGSTPNANDAVTLHYEGTLTNGFVFDSSYARGEPATFVLAGTIDGFREGVQLMPVGSEYRLVMPPELAYGDQGNGVIQPGAVLIFNIELLEINSQ